MQIGITDLQNQIQRPVKQSETTPLCQTVPSETIVKKVHNVKSLDLNNLSFQDTVYI